MDSPAAHSPAPIIWLLPAAFVVHDAEEFFTRAAWLDRHGAAVHAWVQQQLGSDPLTPLHSLGDGGVLRAMAAIFALLLIVTGAFARWPGTATRMAYLVVLGGFFIHGFVHAAQALAFGSYTPGVITAVLGVIPASLVIYRGLRRSERISTPALVATGVAGALLILPVILFALRLGAAR